MKAFTARATISPSTTIEIPDWIGRNADRATAKLEDLGFRVESERQYHATVAAGRVISQSPSSGTGFKGDSIRLVVSRGPELVEIPTVRGRKAADARKVLEDAGFVVKVVRNALYFGGDYVISTDPAEGSSVPRGSTVTLSIV